MIPSLHLFISAQATPCSEILTFVKTSTMPQVYSVFSYFEFRLFFFPNHHCLREMECILGFLSPPHVLVLCLSLPPSLSTPLTFWVWVCTQGMWACWHATDLKWRSENNVQCQSLPSNPDCGSPVTTNSTSPGSLKASEDSPASHRFRRSELKSPYLHASVLPTEPFPQAQARLNIYIY